MTKHNHGAAISGRQSQRKLTEATLDSGFQILEIRKILKKQKLMNGELATTSRLLIGAKKQLKVSKESLSLMASFH